MNGTGTTDTEAEAEVKTFAGFTYDAANTNNQLKGNIAGDGSLELRVYYNRIVSEVTYSYTGNVPTEAAAAPAAASYRYGASVTVAADPTAVDGYEVTGWSRDDFTMPATDVNITAAWTIKSYTITFNSNGGSAVTPITAEYKSAVTKPTDPSRDGYTFAGWDNLPETMPLGGATVNAQWTANTNTAYTVKYML